MDQSWHEMKRQLDSIRLEYKVIWQELQITIDSQHAIRLRAWASACVADYLETIRRYRTAEQSEPAPSPPPSERVRHGRG